MDINSLKSSFPAFALLGSIGLLWNQIKSFFGRIYNLVINRVELKDYAAASVATFVWQNCKGVDSGTFHYYAREYLVKSFFTPILVATKRLGRNYQLFFYGKVPFVIKYADQYDEKISICFLRGTLNFEEFFQKAIDEWNGLILKNPLRFRIETLTGKSKQEMMRLAISTNGETSPRGEDAGITHNNLNFLAGKILKYKYEDLGKDFNSLLHSFILAEELKIIAKEISTWVTIKDWYSERGIPWRRGYLLYGSPGSGKSSLIRYIGITHNLPIFRFDLSSMNNLDFLENWNKISSQSPCIALFEDFDNVFHQRENITKLENGLTFDCFLNTLSGAMPSEGILTFITTNDISKVDSAIATLDGDVSSRPGRIDRVVEVLPLNAKGKRELCEKILKDYPEEIEETLKAGENASNAQFVEICCRIVYSRKWKDIN